MNNSRPCLRKQFQYFGAKKPKTQTKLFALPAQCEPADMKETTPQFNDLLLYTTPDGRVKVDVIYEGETFWLSQKKMAELFGVDRSVITKHIQNVFREGELEENSVCAFFAHTAADGKTYNTQFYNLDAIIAVGYRVNSQRATQFRIWATQTLKEFIIKGFVLDDERLKHGNTPEIHDHEGLDRKTGCFPEIQ